MAKYRNNLPQLGDQYFLTDGGLETSLIFHNELDLPEFAAFVLLQNEKGRTTLSAYFQKYLNIAKKHQLGFILESPTWRASSTWGSLLGHSSDSLKHLNHEAIRLLVQLRAKNETVNTPIAISGCIGPQGDGYQIKNKMSVEQAMDYHMPQIKTFTETEADLVSAFTINYSEEALGIVRASQVIEMPVVIGFTVETDGNLPSGQTIEDAIGTVDTATNNYVSYYMINCAHPTHFQHVLNTNASWKQRIRAVRANASHMSHAELDNAETLDDGDPVTLGHQYDGLRQQLSELTVFGGCCGTDHRHIEAICQRLHRKP